MIQIPSTGKLLISDPTLDDYYFNKSVILIADYNKKDGSFGIIINKPINTKLNDILYDFSDFDSQLYLGGPIKTDRIFFIHTLGNIIEGSKKILDGIYWGGDVNTVKYMIKNKEINSENIRFFIGYSGWAPMQLEEEIENHSWIISKTTANDIIHIKPKKLWRDLILHSGKEHAMWANFPRNPKLN